MATAANVIDDISRALVAIVGAENIQTDEAVCDYFATDVYAKGALPLAVVSPGTSEEVAAIAKLCDERQIALVTRGGGASYTDGYLHKSAGGISIDTARLNAIDIDEQNAVVVVGAGCTWSALYDALGKKGWRTPFWGPFSGIAATVGGSMSQHSISHGTSAFGVSAESLLGIEAVTGTGEILRTGSWGSHEGGGGIGDAPFLRHYGPDMAGLFTGDCGALGVKTRIAMRIQRRHSAFEAISFAFDDFAAMHGAMREIAINRLDDENFAVDQALQQGQIGRNEGVANKIGVGIEVLKSATSLPAGLKQLAKMAVASDAALRSAPYAAHYLIDGVDRREARSKLDHIRAIGEKFGREIPNTVPQVVRAMPFAPLFNTLGPAGERWVPIHGVFAHDKVVAFHQALMAQKERNAEKHGRLGIWQGHMFMAVGSHGFVYEPATYWPGKSTVYHEQAVPAEYLSQLPSYPDNDEVEAAVAQLKSETIDLMQQYGAAHFQIGKVYPYLPKRNPASVQLLRAIKTELDPSNILNPGVLGL